MAAGDEFPQVEVSVVLLERAGLFLVEFNPKWARFTLPMARLRGRALPGGCVREKPVEAAVRAASLALGRPLPVASFPRPVTLDVPPQTLQRSLRDQQTKRYLYRVFALRVTDPTPQHALGWHTLWMRPADLLTHHPVSPTAAHVVRNLPDDFPAA
jgi:hypothetical protein